MGRNKSKLSNAQSQAAEAKTQDASSNTQTIYNAPAEAIQFQKHLSLLQRVPVQRDVEDVMVAPLFTMSALKQVKKVAQGAHGQLYSQYGLLAGINNESKQQQQDPRIFYNVTSPSSLFICGSQGSGKSHTLSCLLENCLIPSDASILSRPLAGLVFHYDSFISDDGGSPCEAAFLASDPKVKVRVLCSPTNIRTIERTYRGLGVTIEPLQIDQENLNTKRMLDLMAANQTDGTPPLYLHVVRRILRDMRIAQQETRKAFVYNDFKNHLMASQLTPTQLGPLNQRLDTLESFMLKSQVSPGAVHGGKKGKMKAPQEKGKMKAPQEKGNDWTHKSGHLTIVDLSCPFVTPEAACTLFSICLSIFLEQAPTVGRVIALDEAHKYMNASAEASVLTDLLLSAVRLQRHLGARVIISTQEPTISPKLLDLCSVTIVHRFTSPSWLRTLKKHLAAAASDLFEDDGQAENQENTPAMLKEIVELGVGEALLFSPSAMVGLETDDQGTTTVRKLRTKHLKIQIRARVTTDGGKSIMAAGV